MELVDSKQIFDVAAQSALNFLKGRVGFKLWMITRVDGDKWIVIKTSDEISYPADNEVVMQLGDSICSRMVGEFTNNIVSDLSACPEYFETPIAKQFPINSCIGYPLRDSSGSLFGTLCAVDSEPQSTIIYNHDTTLELMATLMSSLLEQELINEKILLIQEQLENLALIDHLTGIYNKRAWDELVAKEEERCKRYGGMATAIIIDLNNLKTVNDTEGHDAGDRLLKKTASCLKEVIREADVVARLGGDEFGILLVGTDDVHSKMFIDRLEMTIAKNKINASVGWAHRDPHKGLQHAIRQADEEMYIKKRKSQKLN